MNAYTEDHLIEQLAIQLMEHELVWDWDPSEIELVFHVIVKAWKM